MTLVFALHPGWRRPTPATGPGERFFHTSLHAGRTRVSESAFLENLAACAASAGSARVYVLFPALYNEYGRRALAKSVRVSRPNELDVVARLEAAGGDTARFFLPYDEAHLSPAGHREVAELIWERLALDEALERER